MLLFLLETKQSRRSFEINIFTAYYQIPTFPNDQKTRIYKGKKKKTIKFFVQGPKAHMKANNTNNQLCIITTRWTRYSLIYKVIMFICPSISQYVQLVGDRGISESMKDSVLWLYNSFGFWILIFLGSENSFDNKLTPPTFTITVKYTAFLLHLLIDFTISLYIFY